jgi:hypothetical protein
MENRKRAGPAPEIAGIPRAFGSRRQFLEGGGRIPDLVDGHRFFGLMAGTFG